jgi:RHS repeat-associated protein
VRQSAAPGRGRKRRAERDWGCPRCVAPGLDRFGRVIDQLWYDYGASADAERVKHGYDRDSSRTYRENTVAASSHDQLYAYDNLNRLTSFDKGDLNGTHDGMSALASAQRWTLDPTGNWSEFKEDANGDTDYTDATDLDQDRTHNKVNEVTDVAEAGGQVAWATPTQDLAGNMTALPKPSAPATSLTAIYDAWNRLVEVKEGSSTVATYKYDGLSGRIAKESYTGGSVSETRRFYYSSDDWQVLEERVDERTNDLELQYVWGVRYEDELVVRDRDTADDGTLDERFYALQDANFNVTAIVDTAGDVQERYSYTLYGVRTIYDGSFGSRASSSYDWTVGHQGLTHDEESGLVCNRNRMLHPLLGRFVQRDLLGYVDGMSLCEYEASGPLSNLDPPGTIRWPWQRNPHRGRPRNPRPPAEPKPPAPPDQPCDPDEPGIICKCHVRSWFSGGGAYHGYLWWRGGSCGQWGSAGISFGSGGGPGPRGGHECRKVSGADGGDLTPGQVQSIKDCCDRNRNRGLWLPVVADCHQKTNDCIAQNGGRVPGGVGRF